MGVITLSFSVRTAIKKRLNFSSTVATGIKRRYNASFTVQTGLMHYNPAPVNDILNASNPHLPTIIISPTDTIVTNPATAPTGPVLSYPYVKIDESAILGTCGFQDFSMDLSLGSPGRFEAITQASIGNKGNIITVAGVKALITYTGQGSNRQRGKYFRTKGIFADSRIMNKEIMLVAKNITPFYNLGAKFPLQQPSVPLWSTVKTAAMAIAYYAGINLKWLAPDVPLMDVFVETGMQVEAAIKSLAQRVQGILCFDGLSNWVVITPDRGFGGWAGVPDCSLVLDGGIEVGGELDTLGGMAIIPDQNLAQGVAEFLPNPLTSPTPPKVTPLTYFRQYLQAGSPAVKFTVPGDYDQIMTQIIVDSGSVGPAWTTTNSNQWFGPAFGVELADDGTTKVVINAADFPTGLVNNQFHMNVGYTKDTTGLDNLHTTLLQALVEKKKYQLKAQQERLRYFNDAFGSLTYRWDGSVPFPGNNTTISYDGLSCTGIVTSFSLRKTPLSPFIANVSVGHFKKLLLNTPLAMLDAFLAS